MPNLSRYNPDKRCIFRQVFNSQADIDENPYGKVTTIGTFKFKGDYANFTSSQGLNKSLFAGAFSVRIIIRFNTMPSTGVFVKSQAGDMIRSYQGGFHINLGNNVTYYTNGIKSSDYTDSRNKFVLNEWREYIFTFDIYTYVGVRQMITGFFGNGSGSNLNASVDVKLIEIYNTILSASEIKNLYNNKTLMPFTDSSEIFHLNAYKGVINDKFNTPITYSATKPYVEKNNGYCITLSTNTTQYLTIPFKRDANSTYTFSFWVTNSNKGDFTVYLYELPLDGNGRLFMYKSTPSFNVSLNYVSNIVGIATVPWPKWNHITVVINKIAITTYLNGVFQQTGNSVNTSTQTRLGIGYPNGTRPVSFKNIRIFNKILTIEEISQIYNSERKIFGIK